MPDLLDRFRGALLGLAVGDAIGTTLEFEPRGSFEPITDMVGGGPFGLAPGQWTDDTSMALCLAASLIDCNGFNARDQMERYCRWRDDGYMSSTGTCFDIGNTIASALRRYEATGNPVAGSSDPRSAGNGSLMRLAPVVLFYYPDRASITRYAADSSRTTHAADEAVEACRIFAQLLASALDGRDKSFVLSAADGSEVSERLDAITSVAYRDYTSHQIRGSGYVVDSLEAALWCFLRGRTFSESVLMAANLGDDADTTAAVCGQLAGAYHGLSGIPTSWLDTLALRDDLITLAGQLLRTGDRPAEPSSPQ